jgi:hypothetical protein
MGFHLVLSLGLGWDFGVFKLGEAVDRKGPTIPAHFKVIDY